MRPDEFLDLGQQGAFVKGDASANEVKQGMLGNCWFIGALSVLATNDSLLRGGDKYIAYDEGTIIDRNVAANFSKGVFAPMFHKFRLHKIYVLRFFKDQKWRFVIVDNKIPVHKSS